MHTHLHGPNTLSERGSRVLDRLVILSSRHVMFWWIRSASALESCSLQLQLRSWYHRAYHVSMVHDIIHAKYSLSDTSGYRFEGWHIGAAVFGENSANDIAFTPGSRQLATTWRFMGVSPKTLLIYYICMPTRLPPYSTSTSIASSINSSAPASSINNCDPILMAF
jgi:hypothetical protein